MRHTEFSRDRLTVRIYPNRAEMGAAAACEVAGVIRRLLASREEVNIILGSAPSQNEFIDGLAAEPGIDWSRVNGFHMDEYVGVPLDSPASFGWYLRERLFSRVGLKAAWYIDGTAADVEGECRRYARLLEEHPTDISCLGIGENGHIAFNDPHVAFFQDPLRVKVVEMDIACRRQQVNDKCFERLEDVPQQAITLTVPALMAARHVFAVVPAPTKAQAVFRTLNGEISQACPASVIRTREGSVLFLDPDSASLLHEVLKEKG